MDADTGLRCRLPAHARGQHRHERGAFTRVAAPGETSFVERERLAVAAFARRDVFAEEEGVDTRRSREPVRGPKGRRRVRHG